MKLKKGFTLIELLIVMAVLGVLAVVVLVAINPAEQLRRARDSGKISGVQQIGRAVQAYYTANGTLPGVTGTWDTELVNSEELKNVPAEISEPAGGVTCTPGTLVNNTWCYDDDGTEEFVVYSQLYSSQRENQCVTEAGMSAGSAVYSGFSSSSSRGGLWCGNEPAPGTDPDI